MANPRLCLLVFRRRLTSFLSLSSNSSLPPPRNAVISFSPYSFSHFSAAVHFCTPSGEGDHRSSILCTSDRCAQQVSRRLMKVSMMELAMLESIDTHRCKLTKAVSPLFWSLFFVSLFSHFRDVSPLPFSCPSIPHLLFRNFCQYSSSSFPPSPFPLLLRSLSLGKDSQGGGGGGGGRRRRRRPTSYRRQ